MKECGECNACCVVTEIKVLNKPAGKLCTNYCTQSKKCSVYTERPNPCKTFECLYKQQEQIPDEYRPDRCHIMFELVAGTSTYIGYINANYPDSWKTNSIQLLVSKINKAGDNVLFNNKKYFLAEGVKYNDMISDLKNAHITYKERGML